MTNQYEYRLKPLPSGRVTAKYAVDNGKLTIDVSVKGSKSWKLEMSEGTLDALLGVQLNRMTAVDDGLVKVLAGDKATAWHALTYLANTEKTDIANGEVTRFDGKAAERILRERFATEPAENVR